jgi:hypothetical protein
VDNRGAHGRERQEKNADQRHEIYRHGARHGAAFVFFTENCQETPF